MNNKQRPLRRNRNTRIRAWAWLVIKKNTHKCVWILNLCVEMEVDVWMYICIALGVCSCVCCLCAPCYKCSQHFRSGKCVAKLCHWWMRKIKYSFGFVFVAMYCRCCCSFTFCVANICKWAHLFFLQSDWWSLEWVRVRFLATCEPLLFHSFAYWTFYHLHWTCSQLFFRHRTGSFVRSAFLVKVKHFLSSRNIRKYEGVFVLAS